MKTFYFKPLMVAAIVQILTVTVLPATTKNVLLIIADDLRPQLGCYGNEQMVTPHLDRLAEEGLLFERAYCQQAICGPTRASFMTGMLPESLGVADNQTHFRENCPDLITMPQYFKDRGYHTVSLGKVFHLRDNRSWSEPEWVPDAEVSYPIYSDPDTLKVQEKMRDSGEGSPRDETWWGKGWWIPVETCEISDAEDDELFDGLVAREAVSRLAKMGDEPFFMAVGFFLPHIPYIAPEKYYDLYPEDSIEIADNFILPKTVPLWP